MKTYKGFNRDMTCNGFQYKEGETFVHDGNVDVCESGFHACEDPLECFKYYAPGSSVYHEVEQSGDISKASDDTKVASKIIKIGGRLDVLGLAKAHFEYVKSRTTYEFTDPKAATAGSYGAATSRGTSVVGKYGIACARGNGCKVKGGIGAILIVAEENSGDYEISTWKAVVVDGVNIKADTLYQLKGDELVEVSE